MQSTFWQFIKYSIVGISNTLISQAVYFVIVFFGGNYIFASTMGFIISVLNAYYWSNKYVFKEDKNAEKRVWWKVLLKTYAAYLWGFLVSTVLLIFWVDVVKLSRFMYPLEAVFKNWGWEKIDAQMLGELAASPLNLAVTIPMNFFINKYWAYSQKKTPETHSNNIPEGRMANMELLRIVAMMLIIAAHFLGKGDWLTPLTNQTIPRMGYIAWAMEALVIESLNAYMLLSGYFLIESSFKVKRLLQLLLQILFYSIVIGVIAAGFGYLPEEGFSIYYLAMLCLPISTNHYWFMTAYFFVYLLAPLLAQSVKKLTKKQFQTVLFILLFLFCIIKSVVPIPLSTDMQGEDSIWYICVFLVAAYIRLYGISFFKSAGRSLIVYLTSGMGMFVFAFLLRQLYLQTGKLSIMLTISYSHNHVLAFLASIALFYFFYHLKIKSGAFSRFICRIAPYTLGVYLWHEHIAIRYKWQEWFYDVVGMPDNGMMLLLYTLLAAVLVFIIGILLDMLRSFLFRGLHLLLSHISVYRSLNQWLEGLIIKA